MRQHYKHPRTMVEAFGPYTSQQLHPMPTPRPMAATRRQRLTRAVRRVGSVVAFVAAVTTYIWGVTR